METPTPGTVKRELTLPELMSVMAQRVSFTAALWVCAVGVVGLVAVLLLVPSWWRLALVCLAAACFGAWTMADHERLEGATQLAARWRALQGVSFGVGVVTMFTLFLALLSSALGLWIS